MCGTRAGGIANHLQYSGARTKRLRENENSPMIALVKLVGNLGKLPDGRTIGEERVDAPAVLRGIVTNLQTKYSIELRRDSMLILVNGVEANALDDLETIVNAGDEVVLVPMFHGG